MKKIAAIFFLFTTSFLPILAKDEIVLNEGGKVLCDVVSVPELSFFFDTVAFNKDEIAALSFTKAGRENKMQVIHRSGFCFIGDFSDQTIVYALENGERKYINTSDINYIAFANNNYRTQTFIPERLFNLKLKDGNQLPVEIQNNSISLTEGMKDYYLSVDDIVEIHFNGGLYGFVKDQDMQIKDQKFAFVKERCLLVYIPVIDKTIGLPWEQISSLSREQNYQQSLEADQEIALEEEILDIYEKEGVYQSVEENDFEEFKDVEDVDLNENNVHAALKDVHTMLKLETENSKGVWEALEDIMIRWENICFKSGKLDKEIKNYQKVQAENYITDLSSSISLFENHIAKLQDNIGHIQLLLAEAENEFEMSAPEKEKIADEIKKLEEDLYTKKRKNLKLIETLESIWKAKQMEEEERQEKDKLAGQVMQLKNTANTYEQELNSLKEQLSEQKSSHRRVEKEHTASKEHMLGDIELLNKTLCEERSSSAKLRITFDEARKRATTFEKQLDVLTNSLVSKQQELETIKMESRVKEDELMRQIAEMKETYAKEKKQKDALINSFIDQLEGFKSE